MKRRVPLVLCLATLAAALLAAPAAAKVAHPLETTFDGHETPATSFTPAGVAVDPSSHDLYVSDSSHKVIDKLSSSGAYLCQITGKGSSATDLVHECDPTDPGFGSFASALGEGIVDASGALLFPDSTGHTIDRFSSAGAYLPPQLTLPSSGRPLQVALDSSANLFVADSVNHLIDKYTTATSSWSTFAGPFASPGPAGVAVDNSCAQHVPPLTALTTPTCEEFDPSNSYVYVADPHNHAIDVFEPDRTERSPITAVPLSESLGKLAVDPADGHLFVPDTGNQTLDEFAPGGGLLSQTAIPGSPSASSPQGVAVDPATGTLYVADKANEVVDVFSTAVVPNTETKPAEPVGETSATLKGHVNPDGAGEVKQCRFEYVEAAEYKPSEPNPYVAGKSEACAQALPYAGPEDVSAVASNLAPNTAYHFRLTAANANAVPSHGEDETFTTPGPPTISGEFSNARTSSATVKAQINPHGYEASCEVEYLAGAAYQTNPPSERFNGAASSPCDEAIPAGFGDQPASAKLTGLTIGTLYHYRFIAISHCNAAVPSEECTTEGEDAEFSTFRIESLSVRLVNGAGEPFTAAGGHPYKLVVTFTLSETETNVRGGRGEGNATGNLKTAKVELPPGLIANPAATPTCTAGELHRNYCPPEAQIGLMEVGSAQTESAGHFNFIHGALYNLEAPRGVAAEFGAQFSNFPSVRIDSGVRTGSDYGVDSITVSVNADTGVNGVRTEIWGVPADPSHTGRPCRGGGSTTCPSTAPLLPFLRMPTSCTGNPLNVTVAADAWQEPGVFATASTELEPITGCDALEFEPSLEARPTTNAADSPSGLNADIHVPQHNAPCKAGPPVECSPAVADLKDAKVTLPKGLVLNPAGANGLEGCTPAQVELHGPKPASCPDSSKVGTVEVITPLLAERNEQGEATGPHPLKGGVYVATPFDNPFHSLLSLYIAVHDPKTGVVIKLAGHVELDPNTGQLTTTFDENPQLPFEDFRLDFFGGAFAPLRTPPTCGRYATTSALTPWSAPGSPAESEDPWQITKGPNGAGCVSSEATLPNQPEFDAGTIAPIAAAYSPLVLHLRREDGSQQLSRVTVTPPPGLVGKLAGIPYCSQTGINQAKSREHPGGGAEEQANPSCPAASHVGVVNVSAGAGPAPYWVQGQAYLAGPYKGAPLSLLILTPATAGPLDLGVVVTRVALQVDPETTQISAEADPIPRIIEGIPLDVRTIAVKLDRPQFTLNPTSCDPMAFGGTSVSTLNQAANLQSRFQLGECAPLGFGPKLSLRLFGKTKRTGHPRLRAVLTMPGGGANIARASVALPHSEFLDQSHIRTVCTRVQFAEGDGNGEKCPAGSIYGHAKAWSPLLEAPLQGPVYLRSSSHKLPDLVAALNGQIQIALDGRIDSVNGGIRTSFETVPDAPVSRFVLNMQGGAKGLLVNSTNLCARSNRASALLDAHNGKVHDTEPAVKVRCAKGARRHGKHRR